MSDVIIRDKAEYHARTSEQMERHLDPPPWSLRQKIAVTCRILANEGHESALAGQITARGDRPGTYWMLSFGLGFDEARASNIVLVDSTNFTTLFGGTDSLANFWRNLAMM